MLFAKFLAIIFFYAQVLFSIVTALLAVFSFDDLLSKARLFIHYRSGSIEPDCNHRSTRRDVISVLNLNWSRKMTFF